MINSNTIYPLKLATGHHYYRLKVCDWGPVMDFSYKPAFDQTPEHYIIAAAGGVVKTTIHETVRRGAAEKGLRMFRLIEVTTTSNEKFFCIVLIKRLEDIAKRCLQYSTILNQQ